MVFFCFFGWVVGLVGKVVGVDFFDGLFGFIDVVGVWVCVLGLLSGVVGMVVDGVFGMGILWVFIGCWVVGGVGGIGLVVGEFDMICVVDGKERNEDL